MSDKIKIRYVGGDECEHLESCKTWDDLSGQMESFVQFVTLKHSLTPRVIFEGVDGKNYEATIEFRAIKQEYDEEDADDAVIEALSKVLTKALAAEILLDEDCCVEEVAKVTEINDTAAELLSKHQGELYLHFNSLTEISDSIIESLSKTKGELLLRGLTEISDAAAESLSKYQGDLYLSGVTEISNAAAESFSKRKGGLYLCSVTELSDNAAQSLSKHHGFLSLGDPIRVSNTAAESLSKHEGEINCMDPKEWVESLKK